jgi:proteasome lid subunit RPN8/RPN11
MLYLKTIIKKNLIADAINTFPDECCGFLIGTDDEKDRSIEEIIIVDNAKDGDKRRRFEISPKDYMKAERYADDKNLKLIGIYHSHPNHPSIPSEHDRIQAQPYFSYVIIAVRENEFVNLQSWRLDDCQQFEEEAIELIF